MATLVPEDWFFAARKLLVAKGPQNVNMRELSKLLGVSTGSFYHHFSNRGDFVVRLLAHWGEETERAVNDVPSTKGNSLDEINKNIDHLLDHRLESALRAWGVFDPSVAAQITRVDDKRRRSIAKLYETRLSKRDARNLADLHLCAFAGAQFMFSEQPKELKRFGKFVNACAQRLSEQ
tara:strand:+ start:15945 stop:16478 length:534 start_codon:yes stop_codon:yes gene_type:complete